MTASTVFLDFASTSRGDLDLTALQTVCAPLQLWPNTAPSQLLEHIGSAEVIISNKVVLDAVLLEQLQGQIKLICVAATGTNNVDLAAAQQWGIPVTNVRNYAPQSVAEHVLSLMLALARHIPAYHQAVQQGAWQRSQSFCLLDYPITELGGKTFGVIGYGALGQASAQLAQAIGMQLLIADRPEVTPARAGRVTLNELFQQADVISLHCPLTPATAKLVNAERLRLMKPSAFLINTARGGLIDEPALLQALQTGTIAGAALDVLSVEPPPADAVLLQTALPNLLITPHIAWASQRARQCLLDQIADIIQQWQQGKLINQVA